MWGVRLLVTAQGEWAGVPSLGSLVLRRQLLETLRALRARQGWAGRRASVGIGSGGEYGRRLGFPWSTGRFGAVSVCDLMFRCSWAKRFFRAMKQVSGWVHANEMQGA